MSEPEGVVDTLRCKVGGQQIGIELFRLAAEARRPRHRGSPSSRHAGSPGLRVDPLHEVALGSNMKTVTPVERKPLVGGERGADHRLAVGPVLAQPGAVAGVASKRLASLPKASANRRSASVRAAAASGL